MRSISLETANKIAAAWDSSKSLPDAMWKAGIKTDDRRNMYHYKHLTEQLLGIKLPSHNPQFKTTKEHPSRKVYYDHPYTVVIFSDAHFWPGHDTPAFWGLLEVLEALKPDIVVDNGDSFDGASISRHPSIGWEDRPSVQDEISACNEFLEMIQDAAGDAEFYRNIGNHDLRFEMKLANSVPEFKDVQGFSLSHAFPKWHHTTSVSFNESFLVKHRWKGGIHAAWNNTLHAGRSIATGHTHRLTIRELTDLNGTRYGVETGTLADPYGPQFAYCEHNPVNWQPGFIVAEIDEGLVFPEKAELIGNRIRYRGKYYG